MMAAFVAECRVRDSDPLLLLHFFLCFAALITHSTPHGAQFVDAPLATKVSLARERRE
jgi:hypothetical protein